MSEMETDGVPISLDVLLHPTAVVGPDEMKDITVLVREVADKMLTMYSPGKDVPYSHVKGLRLAVKSIKVDDALEQEVAKSAVSTVNVNIAKLASDRSYIEGAEDVFTEGGSEAAACEVTPLPHTSLLGLWESLFYDEPAHDNMRHANWCGSVKQSLISYCKTSLLFSDYKVDPCLITWNRVLLFHGPPGTGKTSLCKAAAQKLSVALSERYSTSQMVEINTHSLFSKWFSESGKLVMKLFARVKEMAEDGSCLVFLLIDEVESLAAARKAALSSSEPSDSIRVVNALLTQLDAMRAYPNVITLCTSNITEAIDLAFVDRADYKLFLGNPGYKARHHIISSAIAELTGKDLLTGPSPALQDLHPLIEQLESCSGRLLRKLPFLAFTQLPAATQMGVPVVTFIKAMRQAADKELQDRKNLSEGM